MRKFLAVLIVMSFLLPCFALFSSAESEYIFGDLDNDGFVRANDARIVLRYSAGLISFDKIQLAKADINSDGAVKAGDARILLRWSAKLEKDCDYYNSYAMGLSGMEYASNGKETAFKIIDSDLMDGVSNFSMIFKANGDILMLNHNDSTYCNLTVAEQKSLAKMAGSEEDFDLSSLFGELDTSMYRIPKLTSFSPERWVAVKVNGIPCYDVTVETKDAVLDYYYTRDTYTPFAYGEIANNKQNIVLFDSFKEASQDYFSVPAGYTQCDSLEFIMLLAGGLF